MQRAAHAYMQTGLTTNSPGQTVVMLYDGAIRFLNRAKEQIDAKDYAQKGLSISKAIDVINELSATLNKEQGGDIAENLGNLYFWCNARLAMANLKLDKGMIDSVIKVLDGLRGAFAQIQENPEAQAVAEKLAVKQGSETGPTNRGLGAVGALAQAPSAALRGRNIYNKMAQSRAQE